MTETSSNVEILFVRATKADCDNLVRVRKVYERFYLGRQIPSAHRDTYIAGLSNFKAIVKEYHELYNQKRLGHFSADQYVSNRETYANVARIAKDSGQWG